MAKQIVTGAAGFIGSHLVDRLLKLGHEVVGIDNFSTGQEQFLAEALSNSRFRLEKEDLLTSTRLEEIFTGAETVFHLAANADVRFGLNHPTRDLEQNTIVTSHVLEAARINQVARVFFTSTGSVYGEPEVFPTPETAPFPVQTSLYAASKLAGEALLSSYAEGYGMKATVLRFVSLVGERYSHGHIFDFVERLEANPAELKILGNGKQRKSYLYVQDAINAIIHLLNTHQGKSCEIYNLGSDEYVTVDQSADVICEELGVKPERRYTGGERGWVGDSPFIFLDCQKLRATGWKPELSLRDGIRKTVRYLKGQPWLFEMRRDQDVRLGRLEEDKK